MQSAGGYHLFGNQENVEGKWKRERHITQNWKYKQNHNKWKTFSFCFNVAIVLYLIQLAQLSDWIFTVVSIEPHVNKQQVREILIQQKCNEENKVIKYI